MHRAEAARRVERFEITLDPRTLWPGITEAGFAAAMREIVRVTSLLLPGTAAPVAMATPVPGGGEAFGVAAFASGLGPLLGYWSETGRLRVPREPEAVLAEHLDHGRRRATRLRSELERVVAMFHAEAIPVTVLKGMHTGWVYFPEPGTRPAGDIDILIPTDREPAAARLLEATGFRRVYGMSQRSTWQPPDWVPPASVYLTHADNPWTLDLHVTLDRRFANAPAVTRFDVRPEADLVTWDGGGMDVRVLTHPLLACFLAVHAAHHFPYLSTLRLVELALVCARDGGAALIWDRLATRFEATQASAFGYPGLKLTADLWPDVVDRSLLEQLRRAAPARVRALTDRLTPDAALQLFRRSFEAHFLWAGSDWQRLTGFSRWLWPRDSDGARLPLKDAVRFTGRRLRRLAAARLSWRHR